MKTLAMLTALAAGTMLAAPSTADAGWFGSIRISNGRSFGPNYGFRGNRGIGFNRGFNRGGFNRGFINSGFYGSRRGFSSPVLVPQRNRFHIVPRRPVGCWY